MYGLTLHRPWDYAMLNGKDVENRPWKPPRAVLGTRIALHAGFGFDYDALPIIKRVLGLSGMLPPTFGGIIVGTTCVVGWVSQLPKDCRALETTAVASDPTMLPVLKSPWFFGPLGWGVAHTVALAKPVRCPGAQRLWKLPPDIEAAVREAERLAGVQVADTVIGDSVNPGVDRDSGPALP